MRALRTFARCQNGAALVEFGILFPMFALVLGLAVEGARGFWAYQTTVAGVRDATRYLARALDVTICADGTPKTDSWNPALARIVAEDREGNPLLPRAVTLTALTSHVTCHDAGLRAGPTPVATVRATLHIDVPFSGLLRLSGVPLEALQTTVTDRGRVLGS